jgi:WD40 repeat protein/transcriptional regulator with XRE-family HTH domain
MNEFATALEEFRSARDMSKKDLAARSGRSPGYISLLTSGERDAPSEDVVRSLANALGLDGEQRVRLFKAAGYSGSVAHMSGLPEDQWSHVNGNDAQPAPAHEDWEGAPDIRAFHGRQQELTLLEQLVTGEENCRVIAVVGIGGIGKTALITKLAQQVKDRFEYVYWRSLQNAPRLEQWLRDCLHFLLAKRVELPEREDLQIAMLIEFLRDHPCLLIMDNFETVLQEKERVGHYLKDYEGYGRLIQRLGELQHQSCVLLTSREKPREIAALEGIALNSLVRSLALSGMKYEEGIKILADKGLIGSLGARAKLIHLYGGNPLALKLVSAPIREVFGGNIDDFLEDREKESGKFVFGDIRDLLHDQFARLSEREQEVLYWLATEREAVSFPELRENIARLVSKGAFLETLESLRRRSIIESIEENYASTRFTLQPVIREYVTEQFVEQIHKELQSGDFKLFANHALLKAQSKEYILEGQQRFILHPIVEWMIATFGREKSEERLRTFLSELAATRAPNYTAGNILNLLVGMKCDLRDADFSSLCVWQAALRRVSLQGVDFTNADLTGSVFTDAFGIILSVKLSPDGKLLAAATSIGEVRLWDAATGTPLRTFRDNSEWVFSVAFSPDGHLLASGGQDQKVRLWEVSTGRLLKTLTGHTNRVVYVTFNHDGHVLASGGHDGKVRLWCVEEDKWETSSGDCLMVLDADEKRVWSVAFNPEGTLLASGSENQTIQLWKTETGDRLGVLPGHEGFVRSVTFHPRDGDILASGSDDETIRLWNVRTQQPIRVLRGHSNRVRAVAFSPDGKQLVSSSDDYTVRLWDVADGKTIRIFEGHTSWVGSVAFSVDGGTIVSSSDDQTVRLWVADTGARLKTLLGYAFLIESIDFHPDGITIASGGDDQQVHLWNRQSGQHMRSLQGHHAWVRCVRFSPDGQTVASCSDDQTIRLWDVKSGRSLKTLSGHTNHVWSVAFHPKNAQMLASCGEDQTIRLWDCASGQTIRTLQGHESWVWSVAFSPDGSMLASASADQTVRLWDVNTGQLLRNPLKHSNRLWPVAFSPDGTMLATGCEDQNVHIWDVSKGEEIHVLSGHSQHIWSVAFNHDSSKVISSGADQIIMLWDVQKGVCLKRLSGHTNQVHSVVFNPQGDVFASGSHDGTIKIWNSTDYQLLETLKSELPYAGMKITNAAGLTEAQIATLMTLGAVREDG